MFARKWRKARGRRVWAGAALAGVLGLGAMLSGCVAGSNGAKPEPVEPEVETEEVTPMPEPVVESMPEPVPVPETQPAASETQPAGPASLAEAMARLDDRPAWSEHAPLVLARHPAERYLAGWIIVLDPGHGGDGHLANYKRGPTGVREAEVNLRVALLLHRLLTEAGAHVVLTRESDVEVSLERRAEIANTVARPQGGSGADLFISLHHNATSDPNVNYTSVWTHAHADWSEPDLDAARYLTHQLGAALRTGVGRTSPLMSDQQIYDSGFAVLRRSDVPAVLVESSFHSNPAEEQRLRDADYNLREAYAIYRGLCEYAYGGRPTQTAPTAELAGATLRLSTTLDDGLPKRWWGADRDRTLSSTLAVYLDDERIPFDYDPATKRVTATVPLASLRPAAAKGEQPILRIHHANFFKHHNWPQRYALTLPQADGPTTIVQAEPIGARRYRPAPVAE